MLALAALFALGFFAHGALDPLSKQTWLRSVTIAVAMFLMALPLEASAIWDAVRRPYATLLAVLVTFGLLPLLAWSISPLLTKEFAGGLLVAAITPCTMASATVWTRKAGGNDSAATVVTVVTNLICFLITPAWLYVMTGRSDTGLSLQDFGEMVLKLLITVVLPVIAAQLLRLHGEVATWATRNKAWLGIGSQVCILLMVLIGAIHTGQQLAGGAKMSNPVLSLTLMITAVLFVHVSAFAMGLGLAKICGLLRPDQIAVAFAGSQKTLMVGMEVSLGAQYSVLPMVTYHVGQLFIDTLLADWLKRRTAELPPAKDSLA